MRLASSIVLILVAGAAGAIGGYEVGANPAPPPCTAQSCNMTPLQQAQMDLKRQYALEAANNYQQKLAELNAAAEQVKQENHWPAGAAYNGQTGKFVVPQPQQKGKK